ncbi:Isoquinoline 1-oxidoreductase subunit [Bosea sp. PAMC 26642]|uniref:Isoquinoline 1-oxidoreductase subunit n=1 Tax=Bosea sp. (strain PAMC 26642) TaxID=1792307 RepID=UPI00077016BA|nr:Isoquinoline 1-oxidoreductase subunit [Bosea sp. PAMC 26642]AMJ59065.1 Isoquinoline 1-oxidoreductase subunit [Bosea sp. PAMC 26642]
MRYSMLLAAVAGLGLALGGTALTVAQTTAVPSVALPAAGTLRPVESFQSIAQREARSAAIFTEMGKVLQHPRCVNCHPATERPRQTDAQRPHQPLVVRGKDGHGAPGMACTTCHGKENFDPARVPGDGHWALAPASMAWEGKTLGQICEQMKDPNRNGSRDMAALIKHVAEDTLVGWAWRPGPGRQPAPGTQDQFGMLFKAWAETGAVCPR